MNKKWLCLCFALTLINAKLLLWVQIFASRAKIVLCSKFPLSIIPNAPWRRPGPEAAAAAANSVSKLQFLRASSEQHGANQQLCWPLQDKQQILSTTSRVRDGRSLLPQFFHAPCNNSLFFVLCRLIYLENQALPGASVRCTRNRLSESPPASRWRRDSADASWDSVDVLRPPTKEMLIYYSTIQSVLISPAAYNKKVTTLENSTIPEKWTRVDWRWKTGAETDCPPYAYHLLL